MNDSVRTSSTVLVLLAVIAAVTVVAVLAGVAAAQSGEVVLEDPIYADQTEFQVTVTELDLDGDAGCVYVNNSGGGSVTLLNFTEGETRTVTEEDVGSFRDGDEIYVALGELVTFATTVGFACDGSLDSDMVTVQATGSVELEDPISADQETFHATVPELRVDGGFGCMEVRKNGETEIFFDGVTEGDTFTFESAHVDGYVGGDDITAILYGSRCEVGELDRDTTRVTEPAFLVTIESTNQPVIEGDTLEVEARIENTGVEFDRQAITLFVGGDEVDSEQLALDGRTSFPVTLTWGTVPGDAGDHTATVASADDEATTGVTVNEPATFAVAIESTNSPVVEEEALTVNATIENTDDYPDTQNITLAIDSDQVDSITTSLDGGDSEVVTLTWGTVPGDAGDHTATVASENDMDTTEITVDEPVTFLVAIESTNSPVTGGDALEVTAAITNVGDDTDTQDIALTIDGEERDSQVMTLAGGESQSVTLTWGTVPGDAGDHTATVSSADDSDAETVTIGTGGSGADDGDPAADPTFEVTIDDVRLPETAGRPLEVESTIENTGSSSDTQIVTLTINGEERDSQAVTLEPGEAQSVLFSWQEPDAVAEYDIQLTSEDDFDESFLQLGGSVSDIGTGGVLFLMLLLALLLVYYYIRRRRMYQARPVAGDIDS